MASWAVVAASDQRIGQVGLSGAEAALVMRVAITFTIAPRLHRGGRGVAELERDLKRTVLPDVGLRHLPSFVARVALRRAGEVGAALRDGEDALRHP